MRSVLVTGGAGFIGSHLVRALLAQGDRVRVLDNFSSGFMSNIDGLPIELREGDIRDTAQVAAAMQGIDLVFHLAAMISVPESMQDPRGCYETNVLGSVNVLQAARQAHAAKVVLASSCAVYGDAGTAVDETAAAKPASPYAASKLAMEQVAALFSDVYALPTICLRFFNVYGPRQSPQSQYAAAIPIFIDRMLKKKPVTIHGDGNQMRNFVYAGDVARANLIAASKEAVNGHFNIAGAKSVTINDLVATLQEHLPGSPPPVHGPRRAGDIRFSAAITQKAEQALGFRPETALEQGLQLTIQWFSQQEKTGTL